MKSKYVPGLALPAVFLLLVARAPADAPAGQYTIDAAAGTVTDTKTGIVWQRDVPSGTYTWGAAKTYCSSLGLAGGGWRLPSIKVLQTLVDDSRVSPAIDLTAFPNTPSEYFWTSSAKSGSSGASAVHFILGDTTYDDVGYDYGVRVRCVR
ncbi:MAG: DUF1566 domain-containing protein [Myxococcales bacterium]